MESFFYANVFSGLIFSPLLRPRSNLFFHWCHWILDLGQIDGARDYFRLLVKQLKQNTTSRDISECYLVAILQYLIEKVLPIFSVCGRHPFQVFSVLLDCWGEIRLWENTQRKKYNKEKICRLSFKGSEIYIDCY